MSYDDRPIGSHNSNRVMIEDLERTELMKMESESLIEGTLEERLSNKNWKVRSAAYLELAYKFSAVDSNPELYTQHQYLLSKYIGDSHPIAQESALTTLKAFFSKGLPLIAPQIPELTSVLIEKCISSSRSNVHEKAIDVLIELAKTDIASIRTIINSLNTAKNVKMSLSCIQALCTLIKTNGINQIDLPMLFNSIELQATTSTNSQVRAEALEIYKELHKYLKDRIQPYISRLKPIQQESLKQELNKSNRNLQLSENNSFILNEKRQSMDIEVKTNCELNVSLSLSNPLLLINKDTKWTEKKDRINEFIEMCGSQVTKKVNISETVCILTNLIRDNNIVVVNAALIAIGTLYKNVQETYQKSLIHSIVARYKDKKAIQSVNFCLNGIFLNERLHEAFDCIKDELLDKSPAVKINLSHWLEQRLSTTYSHNIGRAIIESGFGLVLAKLTDESVSEIRDAAFCCIGVIQILYEKCGIEKLFVGSQKLERVNKAVEMARIKWPKISEMLMESINDVKGNSNSSLKQNCKKDTDKFSYKQSQKMSNETRISLESTKGRLHSDNPDFERLLRERIPGEILEWIVNEDWKERHKGLTKLNEWIRNNVEETRPLTEALLQFVSIYLKGFKESNVSIFKELLILFQLINSYKTKNKYMVELVIPELIEKVIDPKWSEMCIRIMLSVIDIAGVNVVIPRLLTKLTTNSKNPNIIKGFFTFLFKVLEGYMLDLSITKVIIDGTKEYIMNPNKIIRELAHEFYCKLYELKGETIKTILEDSKEIAIKNLIAEFCKIQLKSKEEVKEPLNKMVNSNLNVEIDLASKLTYKLLSDISDPSIRKRQEAKEQLELILSQYRKISAYGLGPLITALKQRMIDPCKSLCKGFIVILGNVVQAIGIEFKQYADEVLPELMLNLLDNQPYVRTEAFNTINKIANTIGYEAILNKLNTVLCASNQEILSETLNWIIKHKNGLLKVECKCLIPGLIGCFHSKLKGISELAQQVIELVMPIVGKEAFLNEEKKLNLHELKIADMEGLQLMEDINLTDIVLPGINEKMNRIELDKRVKWARNEQKESYLDRLKKQCKKSMNASLVNFMFGQRESINKSIKIIMNAITNKKSIIEVLDLLLKWIVMLLSDTELLNDTIELMKRIFDYLIALKYEMLDYEAEIIFPVLPATLYDTEVIKVAFTLYNSKNVWTILINSLDTDNIVIKENSLTILCRIIEDYGIEIPFTKDIKVISKVLCGAETEFINDICVRILLIMYKYKGEDIWNNLGVMPKPIVDQLQAFFTEFSAPLLTSEKSNDTKGAYAKLSIVELIEMLKEGSIDNKIDALVVISELLENTERQQEVSANITVVFDVFGFILSSTFDKSSKEFPIELMNCFMHVFQRASSSSSLLQYLSKDGMESLLEHLLNNLLKEEIQEVGLEKEGETIMKQLNSCILRILENGNPTSVLCSLIKLLIKHKNDTPSSKFPGLTVKCILKLTKAVQQLLPLLSISEVLLQIHDYLLLTPPHPPFSSPHDELGVKAVKTIINELVKQLREDIWTHYSPVESHVHQDKHIRRWISLILSNLNTSNTELTQIIEELKSPAKFQAAIDKLKDYQMTHPNCDLQKYLKICGPSFSTRILALLRSSGNVRRAKSISRVRQFRLKGIGNVKDKRLDGVSDMSVKSDGKKESFSDMGSDISIKQLDRRDSEVHN